MILKFFYFNKRNRDQRSKKYARDQRSMVIILHIKLLNESNLIILQLSYFMIITYNILFISSYCNKHAVSDKQSNVNKYK